MCWPICHSAHILWDTSPSPLLMRSAGKAFLTTQMSKLGDKISELVVESPAVRTLFFAIFPILFGVFAGSFIFEITTPHGLAWEEFYKSRSFYILLLLTVAFYWYSREVYIHDRELNRFLDANYCIAYMRSKCLPQAAERYKELIRNGSGGELQQAMDELRKILK